MGELRHECGVAAVYHASGRAVSELAPNPGDIDSVTRLIPRMLLDMQNRGQLAAGMTRFHPVAARCWRPHKQLGTVAEAFRLNHRPKFESIMQGLDGPAAIGHVRYATCGRETRATRSPSSAPTAARPSGSPSPSTAS
jgi:amidophosphoribosyltransferase